MSSYKQIDHDIIFEEIGKYIKDENSIAMLEKAYQFAQEKHCDQKRKSGEPYFVHLQNVAYILATLKAGPQTIAAGLLHDTMEDCGISFEELSSLFDEEIANLVEAVTKIGNIKFADEKEYQAANHRKIFIAMAKDIRVIIIKLVDRLHNMRTLNFQPKEKQQKIASETLQVYAPIAHRLGLAELKNELEDLCFLYLNPAKYHEIARLVEIKKSERQLLIQKMIDNLTSVLNEHHFKFRIFGRSKHLYSIYNKMVTKNKRFEEIFDLYAIRIVTETELNCYEILGYIHACYHPISGRLKDYIAMPKMNMYQSLHTSVLDDEGNIFEVQIRTEEMDQIAEMGVAAHWSYKEGKKYNSVSEQKEIENKLGWFHDLVTIMDETALEHPTEFMDQIKKDIFEANIYVMSPKGRIIELPNGSTPLDFAYRIHTEVGHQTVGALVNGVLVPLSTKLKTGDVVSMRTSKQSSGPSEDWIKIVKTATARNKIKAFLVKKENESRAEDIIKGEKILIDELAKRKLDEKTFMEKSKIEGICSQFGVNNYNEVMYAIAVKSISLVQFVEKLTNTKTNTFVDNEKLTEMFQQRTNTQKKSSSGGGVVVAGIDSMKVSLAGCCMPVYGDKIVGYISKGLGVKVHRADCPNVATTNRLIDVQWEEDSSNRQYEVWVKIEAYDRNYLISDIATLLSQYKVSILGINSEVNAESLTVDIDLKFNVKDVEHLELIISNLKKISSVISVTRTVK